MTSLFIRNVRAGKRAPFSVIRCFALFIAVLCAFAVEGCGRREKPGTVHLVLTVPSDVTVRALYKDVVDDFEKKHPRIHVRLIEIPRDYYRKVLVMIAGRDAPDLMWMGQSFAEFATRGAFMDISKQVASEIDEKEYLPQALSWYRIGGKQLGIPYSIDMDFIVYNKKLFDEAGVSYPTDDWDVATFLKKAKKLTIDRNGDGRVDQFGFRGRFDRAPFGAAILAPDGSRALCDSPAMIKCLQFNLDLVYKWKVSPLPDAMEQEGLDIYTVFRQGRAALMRMYTWDLIALRKECADVDWDIVETPRVARRGHWASSQAILVSADTRHPKEAWMLCKAFLSDQFQLKMARRGLPSNLRVAREAVAENHEKPANYAALLKASDALYPFPRVPYLSELLQYYWNANESVMARRATPKEALERAAQAINHAIRRKKRHP